MTLQEVIEALDKLRTESCMKFYSIGKLLKQVKEEKTYQERYRTFDEFLTREHWSKEGYMLMSIVDTFPNIESHLGKRIGRSEEHTSELQSRVDLVCRLLLEKKK